MKIHEALVAAHETPTGAYRVLTLQTPEIAAAARPGQFVHLRVPRRNDLLLRRPFSIFRVRDERLSILYKRVGSGTAALQRVQPGDRVSLLGPLGNGFPTPAPGTFPVLVAGGYGMAPLCFLAERLDARGLIMLGAATSADILCTEDFRRAGWKVRVATVDGSLGEKGLVTDLLDTWLTSCDASVTPEAFACGPDAMLRAVGERAMAGGWNAWLSMEKHMGCGAGVCLACVQKIRGPEGTHAWARVCRDGPVFEARTIVWPSIPGEGPS